MICATRFIKTVIVAPDIVKTQWKLDGALLNSRASAPRLWFFQFRFLFWIVYERSTFIQNKNTKKLNSWPFLTIKGERFSKIDCPTCFPIYSGLFSDFQIQNISNDSRATPENPGCLYFFKSTKCPELQNFFVNPPKVRGFFLYFLWNPSVENFKLIPWKFDISNIFFSCSLTLI